jgi:hypothetical protein
MTMQPNRSPVPINRRKTRWVTVGYFGFLTLWVVTGLFQATVLGQRRTGLVAMGLGVAAILLAAWLRRLGLRRMSKTQSSEGSERDPT